MRAAATHAAAGFVVLLCGWLLEVSTIWTLGLLVFLIGAIRVVSKVVQNSTDRWY